MSTRGLFFPTHGFTQHSILELQSVPGVKKQVISLFNLENESSGLVRNLVGVGIGTDVRAGLQPAASDALAFLIRVNDRTVGLIEDLDRQEKERRRLEAERLLARGPAAVSPASDKGGKGRKRSVFARLASLSPGSRSRRSATPPMTPPESPAKQSAARHSVVGDSSNGGGELQHLLDEERGGGVEEGGAGEGISSRRRKGNNVMSGLEVLSPRGKRRGPLQPPVVHDTLSPPSQSRDFLGSAPVLLHSYAKLLNSLVCGSYNLRTAFFSSCEADLRNIGREGGYLVRVLRDTAGVDTDLRIRVQVHGRSVSISLRNSFPWGVFC